MECVHPITKQPRRGRRLFALISLAVMTLPYSAPAICSALDRVEMGVREMGMTVDAESTVLQLASSSTQCSSIDGCGVPNAGPAASSVEISAGFQTRMVVSVIEPSDPPPQYLALLERPPRA
jgi:hypothetical protein